MSFKVRSLIFSIWQTRKLYSLSWRLISLFAVVAIIVVVLVVVVLVVLLFMGLVSSVVPTITVENMSSV